MRVGRYLVAGRARRGYIFGVSARAWMRDEGLWRCLPAPREGDHAKRCCHHVPEQIITQANGNTCLPCYSTSLPRHAFPGCPPEAATRTLCPPKTWHNAPHSSLASLPTGQKRQTMRQRDKTESYVIALRLSTHLERGLPLLPPLLLLRILAKVHPRGSFLPPRRRSSSRSHRRRRRPRRGHDLIPSSHPAALPPTGGPVTAAATTVATVNTVVPPVPVCRSLSGGVFGCCRRPCLPIAASRAAPAVEGGVVPRFSAEPRAGLLKVYLALTAVAHEDLCRAGRVLGAGRAGR